MSISIIICTKNNAGSLEKTLRSLQHVCSSKHGDTKMELLVVDNGSSDHTREVVLNSSLPRFAIRYLRQDTGGQSAARNAGLREAQGDIIVFTDDDVCPPPTWLDAVTVPIYNGDADIVAGGIRLADELIRPWMEPHHIAMLAANTHEAPENIKLAIGANLVFNRRVLDKVPAFDVELGPGAIGFCDDLLFNWQAREAGFRLVPVLSPEATVVHYPNPARFTRQAFESRAKREGKSLAYIHYHWTQDDILKAKLFSLKRRLRLNLVKLAVKDFGDVPKQAVMLLLQDVAFYDELQRLRGQVRNYTRRGLIKVAGQLNG